MFVVSVMFNKKNYISCFGKGKNNENFMLSNIFLKITGTLLIIFHNANNRVTPPSPPHHTLSNQSAFGHIHSNVVHSTLMWSACKPGYLDTPGRSQASASSDLADWDPYPPRWQTKPTKVRVCTIEANNSLQTQTWKELMHRLAVKYLMRHCDSHRRIYSSDQTVLT